MNKIVFTKEETEDIINLYTKEFLSMNKIGEKYSVSKEVIKRVLKENSIEIRKGNHTYHADYNKFETIDSSEKAYWLGFVAADGCVYLRDDETNGCISLNIHEKDKELLEKFNLFMNSNNPIKSIIQNAGFSNNTPMSRLVFNSKKMVYDFINKGIVQRKSLVLKPPLIEEKYYLPFIMGYFDGDGSIFKTQNKEFGISIEGTKEILEWINSILNISSKLEKRNNDNKNNYYIRCGGINKPYNILKKLYDSSPVYLERKKKIFEELEVVVLGRDTK